MQFLVLALLLVPTAAQLKLNQRFVKEINITDTRPKSATPEGIELLWQRPSVPPKGILLYLHGCHGRATGMFTTEGSDGFHFEVCDNTKIKKCQGFVEEVLMRQRARKKGYLVAAVSGGIGNPRGCQNTNDVPRIQLAMKYLVEQEPDFKDKPVIMMGHSSGGRILPELVATGAGIANAKCIVPIADEIRVKGDSAAPLGVTPNYPEDVSVFFVHMERDVERENNIQKNIVQMRQKNVRTGDLKIGYAYPLSPEFFNADGYGLDLNTSTEVFKAMQRGKLVGADKVLNRNPYDTKTENWKDILKKQNVIKKAGGYANLQQYMDVAWNEHWNAGGRFMEKILDFCEQPGHVRRHSGGSPDFDLKSKVKDINSKAAKWSEEQEKITSTFKGKKADLKARKDAHMRNAMQMGSSKKK